MTKCCSVEPMIVKSFNRIEGDNSSDTPTKLYRVMIMQCRNPQCKNYGKTWEEVVEEEIGDGSPGITGINNI